MKSILKSVVVALLFVGIVSLNGCESNTGFEAAGEYSWIYMPQAREQPAEHSLIMVDSLQTITYGAAYGSPGSLDSDLEVNFSVDASLLDSVNASWGTSYSLLPEASYELSQTSAVIPAGETSTAPLDLNITTIGAIEPVTQYVLPVSITTNGSTEINSNLKTTYFLIQGNFIEFSRSNWTILDVDSEQLNPPLLASNILDGDANTFWHTMYSPQRPPLPHHVSIDMGETMSLHGMRIIGRQGFTRGDPEEIIIEVSSDGENWVGGETFTTTFNSENQNTFYLSSPQQGRYFRITVTDAHGFDDPPITHFAEVYAF